MSIQSEICIYLSDQLKENINYRSLEIVNMIISANIKSKINTCYYSIYYLLHNKYLEKVNHGIYKITPLFVNLKKNEIQKEKILNQKLISKRKENNTNLVKKIKELEIEIAKMKKNIAVIASAVVNAAGNIEKEFS